MFNWTQSLETYHYPEKSDIIFGKGLHEKIENVSIFQFIWCRERVRRGDFDRFFRKA